MAQAMQPLETNIANMQQIASQAVIENPHYVNKTFGSLHRSRFIHKTETSQQTDIIFHKRYADEEKDDIDADFDTPDEQKSPLGAVADAAVTGDEAGIGGSGSGDFQGSAPLLLDKRQELKSIPLGNIESSTKLMKTLRKKNPRIVFWECKIKRISDINTTTETFRCRFHYYLTWLATKEELRSWNLYKARMRQKRTEEFLDLLWEPEWVPQLDFTNAVDIHLLEVFDKGYTIKDAGNSGMIRSSWPKDATHYDDLFGFDPRLGKWIRCRYEADVTFAEEMELENFPFDCQDFTIYFKAQDDVRSISLLPFARQGIFASLDPQFSVLSEWSLERLMTEFKTTDFTRSRGGRDYALVAVHVKAARRWKTHLGDMLLTFCMFTLGLGTFSMAIEEDQGDVLGERLGYCVTLMLADVASLQLLIDQLPNIPYWTEMDFYMYSCFFYLFFITGWSCLVGVNVNSIGSWDWGARIVFFVVWFVLNGTFIIRAFYLHRGERATLDMTDGQLQRHYRSRRSRTDRRPLQTEWKIDHLDFQTSDKVLAFTGHKETKGQAQHRRELLGINRATNLQFKQPTQVHWREMFEVKLNQIQATLSDKTEEQEHDDANPL